MGSPRPVSTLTSKAAHGIEIDVQPEVMELISLVESLAQSIPLPLRHTPYKLAALAKGQSTSERQSM